MSRWIDMAAVVAAALTSSCSLLSYEESHPKHMTLRPSLALRNCCSTSCGCDGDLNSRPGRRRALIGQPPATLIRR